MTEIDIMTQQKYEQQLADIFLLLIAIQSFVAFEFAAYVGKFLVYALHFRLFAFTLNENERK